MLSANGMRQTGAWIRWPDRRCWSAFFHASAWLMLLWVVVYGGANWLTGLHDYRVRLDTRLDGQMPFVPATAIIYLSLFPMLWLSPFVLQTPQRLKSFAWTLAALIALSGIGFLILPAEPVYAAPDAEGAIGVVFRFADWLNLDHNYLPSLHVGMAVVCAGAYSRCGPITLGVISWLWAAAITFSTLLTHQHYVADAVAGAALGFLVTRTMMSNCASGGQWKSGTSSPLARG
jgi:membrane-associated phospholipid phosphatase